MSPLDLVTTWQKPYFSIFILLSCSSPLEQILGFPNGSRSPPSNQRYNETFPHGSMEEQCLRIHCAQSSTSRCFLRKSKSGRAASRPIEQHMNIHQVLFTIIDVVVDRSRVTRYFPANRMKWAFSMSTSTYCRSTKARRILQNMLW
jgi:hypothetical protein